ncbi:DUF3105 domain-containing protein [Streptomyces erythrochromogenes]|uniref:DUF3105 domain-containing protein n=1 Tax=Streptomyces erythrochromogenes TaxID=285574 RepID=UPI00380C89CF
MTQNQHPDKSSSSRPESRVARNARLLLRRGVAATAVMFSSALIVGVTAVASAHDGPPFAHSAAKGVPSGEADIPGVQVYANLQRPHVLGPVDYSGGPIPPVGGPHDPVWQNANGDVYDQPLRNEHAVHSLEHGVVWVTYAEDASTRVVDAFKKKVRGVPYRMMSPIVGQGSPVKLTAWGRQLSVASADDPRVDQFFKAYVQGPQAPEPEGPVTGGRATP